MSASEIEAAVRAMRQPPKAPRILQIIAAATSLALCVGCLLTREWAFAGVCLIRPVALAYDLWWENR